MTSCELKISVGSARSVDTGALWDSAPARTMAVMLTVNATALSGTAQRQQTHLEDSLYPEASE